MSQAIRPKAITLNKTEHQLQITWSDDLVCHYPLSELREACPCVECRGGHQYMGQAFEPDNLLSLKPARSYEVTTIDMIGNYAVQPPGTMVTILAYIPGTI